MPVPALSGELHFLDVLAPGQLEALQALGRRRRHDVGEALLHEHDPGDVVLVLLAGRVKITCVTSSGREAVLGIRETGDLIGEMSAMGDEPRTATAIALEPVEVLAVPASAFVGFVDRAPGVAVGLVRVLVRRLADADRKRVEFLAQDTLGRVCERLLELAERFGEPGPDGVRVRGPITQEELAGWTGASREAVVKALRTLREHGWIATGRREIVVRDADALRRRAATPAQW